MACDNCLWGAKTTGRRGPYASPPASETVAVNLKVGSRTWARFELENGREIQTKTPDGRWLDIRNPQHLDALYPSLVWFRLKPAPPPTVDEVLVAFAAFVNQVEVLAPEAYRDVQAKLKAWGK